MPIYMEEYKAMCLYVVYHRMWGRTGESGRGLRNNVEENWRNTKQV